MRVESDLDREWYFYHIVLTWPNGTLVRPSKNRIIQYKGITLDLVNRLRQHSGIIARGARSTSKWIKHYPGSGFQFIYFVGPFIGDTLQECHRQALHFEFGAKAKGGTFRKQQVLLETRQKMVQEIRQSFSNRSILDTLELFLCKKWVRKGDEIDNMPLNLTWCIPEMRSDAMLNFLPTQIKEVILTTDEKKQMFITTDRIQSARPWIVEPWNSITL